MEMPEPPTAADGSELREEALFGSPTQLPPTEGEAPVTGGDEREAAVVEKEDVLIPTPTRSASPTELPTDLDDLDGPTSGSPEESAEHDVSPGGASALYPSGSTAAPKPKPKPAGKHKPAQKSRAKDSRPTAKPKAKSKAKAKQAPKAKKGPSGWKNDPVYKKMHSVPLLELI